MYCAYLRKSRSDYEAEHLIGAGETLTRHRYILESLAEKMNITIDKWYSEVISGDTIAERPVMQELLGSVESGMWEGVFVVEIERLARGNTKDQGIVADAFKYSNTQIITPAKIYNPSDEFDEEYFEFGLFMSRREYKTINRRLQRGRIASVKEGNFVGSTAPYGYRKIKNTESKGYTLEIIPEQAAVVQQIFNWYCYGIDGSTLGFDAIARKLDSLGIKPLINASWSKASVSDILQNEIYAGRVYFGQRKYVKTSTNGIITTSRIQNPNYISARGKHQAIITPELFALAQQIRSANKKNTLPSQSILQNPFSGIIYCKKCGHLMTRLAPNSRNKYSTIKCPNRYCNNISSPLFLIERQVKEFLQEWLNTYELQEESDAPLTGNQLANTRTLIDKLDKDIAGVRKQMEKAYEFLEKEIYDVETFQHRHASLTEELSRLDQNRNQLQHEINLLQAALIQKETFIPKIRHLLETYDTNTPAANNKILKEVIERIIYEKAEPNRRGRINNMNFTLNIFPKVPS